jgi:hypothetical protein
VKHALRFLFIYLFHSISSPRSNSTMASVDFKAKYEEELKARKRAEIERDTLAKQLGKKSSGISAEEVQEEQAQLVFGDNGLSLNGVHFEQLKVRNHKLWTI